MSFTFTEADFKARYPEFGVISTPRFTALAAEADRATGDTWGSEREDIGMLTIAVMLSVSPTGRAARLDSPDQASTYEKVLDRRKKAHAYANFRLPPMPLW